MEVKDIIKSELIICTKEVSYFPLITIGTKYRLCGDIDMYGMISFEPLVIIERVHRYNIDIHTMCSNFSSLNRRRRRIAKSFLKK